MAESSSEMELENSNSRWFFPNIKRRVPVQRWYGSLKPQSGLPGKLSPLQS